jgi:molybdate/tungstate transport system substrate-binding protein
VVQRFALVTRRRARIIVGAVVALISLLDPAVAALGLTRPSASVAGKAPVSVLFAGSLVKYLESDLGPAFQRSSGYEFRGFGGGSTELAAEIKGQVRRGDVFVSASAKADKALEGSANGSWVSWYTAFAGTPLMLAYNPRSRFGSELAHGKPWYKVITEHGIIVGRTDPTLDPKGVLTVEAVQRASEKLGDPALAKALSAFPVYPETALVGRLQAGQLDAGFFYAIEASTSHLVTVPLTPVYKYAEYTVTILNRAPNATGGAALVRYLLNSARRSSLRRNGLNPNVPQFSGSVSAVPRSLRSVVGAH